MYEIDNQKFGRFVAALRKEKGYTQKELAEKLFFLIRRYQNGNVEFPIVKDTTPNMMNPRLYTTSYNKP